MLVLVWIVQTLDAYLGWFIHFYQLCVLLCIFFAADGIYYMFFLFICLFCLNSDQLIYILNDLLIDRLIDLCVYLATFFAAFIFTVAIYMLSVNVLIYLSHCVSVLVRT